jgi:hypothetical protein
VLSWASACGADHNTDLTPIRKRITVGGITHGETSEEGSEAIVGQEDDPAASAVQRGCEVVLG